MEDSQILWLADAPRRPLCDVPWMGNTVVLANGDVNFCCFSDTVVGNVNDTPLGKIWNNDTMRRIRRELRDQTLPPECRSSSCPIYRGDENHIILTRMDGAYHNQPDPHAEKRRGFAGSCINHIPPSSPDGSSSVELEVQYRGEPVCVDVYLAIRGEDGTTRFLPRLEENAFPYQVGVWLPADLPLSARWPTPADSFEWQGRSFDVGGAVFESGSHPNIPSNCYWHTTMTLLLGEPQQDRGALSDKRIV